VSGEHYGSLWAHLVERGGERERQEQDSPLFVSFQLRISLIERENPIKDESRGGILQGEDSKAGPKSPQVSGLIQAASQALADMQALGAPLPLQLTTSLCLQSG
jgi:hypothetical protein